MDSNLNLKLSFYTRYDRLGASSRIRFLQFIPKLELFYNITVSSLLSNDYVLNLYNGQKQSKIKMLLSYLKRFWQIYSDKSDFIIIEKELFPFLPYWLERVCLKNKKYLIDIDDAVFLNYEKTQNTFKKLLLQNKFRKLFTNSYAVLAGSPYLKDYAIESGARRVIYYPTVVEMDNYCKVPNLPMHDRTNVVIGWIGSGSTVKYLKIIKEPLEKIAELNLCKIKLLVIGAKLDFTINNVDVHYQTWSEDSEVLSIKSIDIGIMPLEDSDWEKGKCAYKLIQYMACSKPVIASAVGANNIVVADNENGYLCKDSDDWYNAFIKLLSDINLREEMGQNGLNRVHQMFTVDYNIRILRDVLEGKYVYGK